MANCGGCGGNCDNCAGCGAMELNAGELSVLEQLRQIPFLPVARRADSDVPVYPEAGEYTAEEYSVILQCLEKKGLISIDYDMPLRGYCAPAYEKYPIRGSFALTLRGQQVLDLLDVQGFG
jgi:hypothetical protein